MLHFGRNDHDLSFVDGLRHSILNAYSFTLSVSSILLIGKRSANNRRRASLLDDH